MKNIFKNGIIILFLVTLLTGCVTKKEELELVDGENDQGTTVEDQDVNLYGHSLLIFCGAGMKDPFEKIAELFEETTGCEMHVTYGNAAQSHTQINKSQEGDFFIAGSDQEVKPVEEFVLSSKDLVEHIPVLVVENGNPKEINGPLDLAKEGVRFIMGDPEATPIGKIANKMISDFELEGKIDIIANTATAPAIVQALEVGEADVGLVWKENIKDEKLEIVDSREMDKYIKTIPAVMLSTVIDEKAQKIFNDYLDTQEVKNIWIEFGYKIVE